MKYRVLFLIYDLNAADYSLRLPEIWLLVHKCLDVIERTSYIIYCYNNKSEQMQCQALKAEFASKTD